MTVAAVARCCWCCCCVLVVLVLVLINAPSSTFHIHSKLMHLPRSFGRGRDGRSTEKTDVALRLSAELVRGAHDNGLCVAQTPACAPRVYSTAVGRIKELDWRGRGRGGVLGRPLAHDGRNVGDVLGRPLAHDGRGLVDGIGRPLGYDVPVVLSLLGCGLGVATGGSRSALPDKHSERARARRGDEPRGQVDDENDRH